MLEQRAQMCEAMVAISAQLARLLQRMHKLAHSKRYYSDGMVDGHPDWGTSDLDPPSPLLEGMHHMALSGGIVDVLAVQARLLAACASDDDIDPQWVCRVLQVLGGDFSGDFSPLVKRMAEITGAQLPSEPRGLHNGLGLSERIVPGEWRAKTIGHSLNVARSGTDRLQAPAAAF